MPDFVPGDPINAIANESEALISSLLTPIQEAENVLDETDAAVVVPIIESVTQAEAECEKAAAICSGEIAVQIDAAETVIKKVKKKVLTRLTDLMSDAYMYMGQVDIPVPTEDEVLADTVIPPTLPVPDNNEQLPETPQPIPQIPDEPDRSYNPYGNPGEGGCPSNYFPVYAPDGSTIGCQQIGGPGWLQPTPPATMPGGSCPPGYVPASGSSGFNPLPIDPTPQSRSEPVGQQCQNPLRGWVSTYNEAEAQGNFNIGVMPPWEETLSSPPGMSFAEICIPAAFIPPNFNQEVCVHYPASWDVFVDPITGTLIASKVDLPGYLRLTDVIKANNPCGPNDPNVPPGCVPAGQNQQCIPPGEPCFPPKINFDNLPAIGENEDHCKLFTDVIAQFENVNLKIGDIIGMAGNAATGGGVAAMISKALIGVDASIVPNLLNRLVKWLQTTIEKGSEKSHCTGPAFVSSVANLAAWNFVDRFTGAIPDQITVPATQVVNTICQYKIPNGTEADLGYLADVFNNDEWECYHKAEGDHLGPARKLLDAQRVRPDPLQIDLLWRRKYIDEQDYRERMRQAGVLKDADRSQLHNLNDQWPTVSDLVPMMQRDVFDPDAVKRGKLDEDFDKKFQGRAKDYAEALGMPEELMKFHWMKHWHIPSYTMGREFVHRFNNPELPENIRFTEDDFKEMLKQDDWAPGYIDRMIAATYHEINLTDALRAYMIHISSDEEFKEQLGKLGYSKKNADFMQRYHKKRREIADRKAAGYPTFRTAINSYARCELTQGQLRGFINKIAIDEDQQRAALEAADLSRSMWERKQTIRTVKRPFVQGIYDDAQAIEELQKSNVDPDCVASLLEMWKRERLRKGRQLTPDQLCDMYAKGIIDAQLMLLALVRIGWDQEDAALLVMRCGAKISEAEERKARAEQRRIEAERRRAIKEAEKAKRLAECGPVPCPTNRTRNNPPSEGGQ